MTFHIGPHHLKLLCGTRESRTGLLQLYKATPEQLCRLYYSPASIKYVKANLKQLVDAGYVQAGRYVVEYKHLTHYPFRARYYYMLAPPSVKYMAGLGFDVSETWKPSTNSDKHGWFVPHTLEVNDVIIAGALLKGVDPRFQLESFIHESTYKSRPIQVASSNLMPDACLIFHQAGTSVRFPVLLEHDRDTEGEPKFKAKIRAYLAFINSGGYERELDSERVNVVFTTFHGEDRLRDIRRYTRQVLDTAHAPREVYDVFRFASLPHPLDPESAWLEPRWHYPDSDDQPPQPLLAA